MIRRVRLQRFKRFDDVTFTLPGNLVLAGPNNTGKTTLLQAIAAWSLALSRWKELNSYNRRGGAYEKQPIARQAFAAVPLRRFDLLWRGRDYERAQPITIEIDTDEWALSMELTPDSTEQIYVRPHASHEPSQVKQANLATVFVPPMTGLGIEEPVYQRPKVDQLLGSAKPGDVLRNLLVEAHQRGETWQELTASIARLFGYTLLPPDSSGPSIIAEYVVGEGGLQLDIASAGSGFQQVLMLLTFLYARPASVLLLDEPDAHLHVILQDAIFGELRAVAASQHSQLVVATHSEVVINAADLREVCVLLDRPTILANDEQRERLLGSLRVLTNQDIMLAQHAPGVLYLEGHTDLELLRAFARVLQHPASDLLTTRLFWRPVVAEAPGAGAGIKARDHYDALRLARDIPALQLVDGDSVQGVGDLPITGTGFQRLRWRRYEIESYLVHPAALTRFVTQMVGEAGGAQNVADLHKYLQDNLPPAVYERPLDDHDYLNSTKARVNILSPALSAAGLPGLPYTRYSDIAASMLPEEVHPEVTEKLDAIMRAFGL